MKIVSVILLGMALTTSAQAQFINSLNNNYNGVDGSVNPLHPQAPQPYVQPDMHPVQFQPTHITTCQTFFGVTTCN